MTFAFKSFTTVFDLTLKEMFDWLKPITRKRLEENIFLLQVHTHLAYSSRWANLYFLFLVILNWMPSMEVFHREITMLPLATVLFIIMVKDGIEDFKRYRFDREMNSASIQIYER